MLRRCKNYRDNNIEKEKYTNILHHFDYMEDMNENQR